LNNSAAKAKMDILAKWTAANYDPLDVRTQLWRGPNHYNHMHVDFYPGGSGTPPVLHSGGIFGRNGIGRIGDTRFEAPALLQYGETVLSKKVTQSLARAADVTGGDIRFEINIGGDFYGDDNSYRRLHDTLERVGNKINRERGVPSGTVLRMDGF